MSNQVVTQACGGTSLSSRAAAIINNNDDRLIVVQFMTDGYLDIAVSGLAANRPENSTEIIRMSPDTLIMIKTRANHAKIFC